MTHQRVSLRALQDYFGVGSLVLYFGLSLPRSRLMTNLSTQLVDEDLFSRLIGSKELLAVFVREFCTFLP